MPETAVDRHPLTARCRQTAAVLASSLLFSGCAVVGLDGPPHAPPSSHSQERPITPKPGMLPRCFDKPLSQLQSESEAPSLDLLSFPYDSATETIANDPIGPIPQAEKLVTRSIVQIIRPDKPRDGVAYNAQGSGFIVKNAAGRQFVVTAAHVVMPAKIKQLTVINNAGQQSRVTSGCYIYENPGVFETPKLDSTRKVGADIAVLRLKKSFGHTALKFAEQPPVRGDWGIFVNYQGANGPGMPAEYTGIFARTDGQPRVITGVEPWVTPNKYAPTQAKPGSSGGAVINSSGEIIGMSYAGVDPDKPLSDQELREIYGVTFPNIEQAAPGRFLPTAAVLMDIATIQHALTSPKLS